MKNLIRRLSRRTSTKLVDQEKLETLERELMAFKKDKNMNEIITKNLCHKDPQGGKNTVYFNYLEGVWKELDSDDNFIQIFKQRTNYFYRDDKAAEIQLEYHKEK